jgi:elongation factor P hydroxylase
MGVAERVTADTVEPFRAERLEQVFDRCFAQSYNTRLLGGADEPLYQPATVAGASNAIRYRQDYFASALHEVSHWCIAGAARRRQLDFGYWYAPEGRCVKQQLAFETVERKPQALEWYFSKACNYRFQVSADNLALANAGTLDTATFPQAVLEQVLRWQADGLPERAAVFYRALCSEFGTGAGAETPCFTLEDLR